MLCGKGHSSILRLFVRVGKILIRMSGIQVERLKFNQNNTPLMVTSSQLMGAGNRSNTVSTTGLKTV